MIKGEALKVGNNDVTNVMNNDGVTDISQIMLTVLRQKVESIIFVYFDKLHDWEIHVPQKNSVWQANTALNFFL